MGILGASAGLAWQGERGRGKGGERSRRALHAGRAGGGGSLGPGRRGGEAGRGLSGGWRWASAPGRVGAMVDAAVSSVMVVAGS
jgi:hypothetical protein